MNKCLCGCGQEVKNKYVRGHNRRGIGHTKDGKKVCPSCKIAKPLTAEFWRRCASSKTGYYGHCKICHSERSTLWAKNNPDSVRKRVREWKQKDRKKRPQHYQELHRKYGRKLKLEMIAAYGGKCTCCGEAESQFLTLEHIKHDGKEHRERIKGSGNAIWLDLKRRGWPQDGFTVLCWNCQMATAHGDICPHKRG